jgi:hypothetical protein
LEEYSAYVLCVENRHTGKLVDIQQMEKGVGAQQLRVANQGKGKMNGLGEDRSIRTVNKNIK